MVASLWAYLAFGRGVPQGIDPLTKGSTRELADVALKSLADSS